jgi:uncharacterized protein YegP (UPF0339 family)
MKNKNITLKLYRDKRGQFRWTLIASNGKKLADSGEAYKRRGAMEKALTAILLGGFADAEHEHAASLDEDELRDFRPDITLSDETDGKASR